MLVDYVRVYQKKDQKNIGCDPEDFPTADYINTYVYFLWHSIIYIYISLGKSYIEAYTNPNLTTWKDDFKQPVPKNSLVDGCD